MKRIVALAVMTSVIALFAFTAKPRRKMAPRCRLIPPAVAGPGTHTFTLTGSGWTSGSLIFIVPCTVPGEQLTTAMSTDEIVAVMTAMGPDNCVLSPIGGPAVVGGDGTFTVEVTHDVPANFAFGSGDATAAESSSVPVLFIDDMADDMAPDGGAETGFGGTAGSDGNSVAVPLTAALVGATLLAGAALAVRRDA